MPALGPRGGPGPHVLVAATVLLTQQFGDGDPPPVAESSSSSTTSTSKATGGGAAGAEGCLGGVNPSRAVLAAQEEATLDPKGAAAFAATFMRWRTLYPQEATYEQTAAQVLTPDAGDDLLKKDPTAPGSGSGWMTTTDGRYEVTQSDEQSATVRIVGTAYAKDGEDEQTATVGGSYRLKVVDGHWRVADVDGYPEAEMEELKARGEKYKGGC